MSNLVNALLHLVIFSDNFLHLYCVALLIDSTNGAADLFPKAIDDDGLEIRTPRI